MVAQLRSNSMRLDDLYSYNSAETLSEAPYGMMDKMKDKVKSKMPFADREAAKGRQDSGQLANQTHKEWRRYAGKVAGGQKQIDSQHLIDFLGSKGMPVDGIQPGQFLSPKDTESMVMKAAQGAGQVKAAPAQPRRANPETKTKPQNNEPQASPKPGDTTDTYPEASKPAPQPQAAPVGGNDLMGQLRGMSAEDRRKIAKYMK